MINFSSKIINEFVDEDGNKIGGDDGAISVDDAVSASDYTTDDFVRTSRQGMSRYLYRSFYGEEETEEEELDVPKSDKKKAKKFKKKGLKETSKQKMRGVLEDIFTKQDFDRDIVDRYKNSGITRNGIPPLDTIRDTNPILIRKVSLLKDIMDKNDATGEEKAVIFNHLLDMNLVDIPREYKEELKKKLK
jgi:hypothetical protein